MAKIPPPSAAELREGTGSDSSWGRVSNFAPQPRRTRRLQEMSASAEAAEEEANEIDEIRMLETRLATLKERRALDARMINVDEDD